MEELREQLYKFIEKYGPLDPRTVEVSRKLDLEILKSIKKKRWPEPPKNLFNHSIQVYTKIGGL